MFEDADVLLQDELAARLDQRGFCYLLELGQFEVAEHLAHGLVVVVVHALEGFEGLPDVDEVGVALWCVFQQILQENNILGQPLHRLNEEPIDAQPPKLGQATLPREKLIKLLILRPEPNNGLLPMLIVIAVLEVNFEEGRKLHDLIEDQLIVEVILELIPHLTVELLIELFDLLDIREDEVGVLDVGELQGAHGVLEVADD